MALYSKNFALSGKYGYTLVMDHPYVSRQPTDDGFDTLYSHIYQQTYHSTFGARLEADYVFLKGTGIDKRLRAGIPTRILEIGFGTGLNFLLTAHLSQLNGTPLHYVSLEKYLLPAGILSQLNHQRVNTTIHTALLNWYGHLQRLKSGTRLGWSFGELIQLEVLIGDATSVDIPPLDYHAIYHDAFSPEVNPELWTADFFTGLFIRLHPGGTLATYSVKGAVRRALQAVGFEVHKRPGPPGKREVLVAIKRE